MRASRSRQRRSHIGGVDFLRDMLRTIGVPGGDREQDRLRRARPIVARHERRHQGLVAFDHAGAAPDFDAAAGGVVDQEQMRLIVLGEIANGDELPVAGEIDEADRRLVEHAQKTRRPPAMLDVGLAEAVRGRHENAGLCADEFSEFWGDPGRPAAGRLDMGIGPARSLALLHGLDRRREGDVAGTGAAGFIHGCAFRGRDR